MQNIIQAGALALAMTGLALAGAAPAEAAIYHTPGLTIQVASHAYGSPWWWQHHPRPKKVKVCKTNWVHHHRVTTCTWVWPHH